MATSSIPDLTFVRRITADTVNFFKLFLMVIDQLVPNLLEPKILSIIRKLLLAPNVQTPQSVTDACLLGLNFVYKWKIIFFGASTFSPPLAVYRNCILWKIARSTFTYKWESKAPTSLRSHLRLYRLNCRWKLFPHYASHKTQQYKETITMGDFPFRRIFSESRAPDCRAF